MTDYTKFLSYDIFQVYTYLASFQTVEDYILARAFLEGIYSSKLLIQAMGTDITI